MRAAVPPRTASRSAGTRSATAVSTSSSTRPVVGREQADRPVGPEHAALGPEQVEREPEVVEQPGGPPVVPRRLGHEPGELARDVRRGGERREPTRPGLGGTVAGRRLRQVVDDEREAGVAAHGFERRRQLRLPHEQVEHEPALLDRVEAGLDLGPGEPPRVGLVVRRMADPDEPRPEPGERTAGLRGGEVDPADDAEHERRRRRRREERRRLGERGLRLNRDGAVDAVRAQQRPELVGAEASPDRRQLFREPGVVRAGRVEEVLVRVDSHGTASSGTSSAGPRLSRSQSSLVAMWSRVVARARSASPAAIAS